MKQHKFYGKCIAGLVCCLAAFNAEAAILDVNITGIVFHPFEIRAADLARNPMPRSLDAKSVWVITPGLLLGYDCRNTNNTQGSSVYSIIGYFQDCYDWPFVLMGSGMRYRFVWARKWAFDGNLLGVFITTQQKACPIKREGLDIACVYRLPNTHTRLILSPYLSVGIQYQLLDNMALGASCICFTHGLQTSLSVSYCFAKRTEESTR